MAAEPRPPKVSILIVTYNHEDEIADCLDAALAQEADELEVEVVVTDNASTDETRQVLERYADRITLVQHDENLGYAPGVNAAFAASTGEWVLLLNPDAVMDPGCVAGMVAHLRAHDRVGAAAALLRSLDGSPQLFARREVDLATVFWTATEVGRRIDEGRRASAGRRWRTYADDMEDGLGTPLPVDCPAAACVVIRRQLLEPRPLDTAFPLFFNDADLYRRLRRAGWGVEVVPSATATHGYATSVRRADVMAVRAEWVAATREYLGSELGPLRRAVLWTIFVGDAITTAVLYWVGRGRPEMPGVVKGTLGGLGLPGGRGPLFTPVRPVLGGRRADYPRHDSV